VQGSNIFHTRCASSLYNEITPAAVNELVETAPGIFGLNVVKYVKSIPGRKLVGIIPGPMVYFVKDALLANKAPVPRTHRVTAFPIREKVKTKETDTGALVPDTKFTVAFPSLKKLSADSPFAKVTLEKVTESVVLTDWFIG